ncbi:unnamed protein product [Musa acuminata subsp. malaccensis]|uniref:(wild Malaysian banana) hypothetical protein n=1 Tax=Musa acuminata subsp. malaccensis TaxID=214687 RepID=A0A8D7FCY8_MUSAM|nr:unnamed protein product [Musa acuminata subsp. malaccensis]
MLKNTRNIDLVGMKKIESRSCPLPDEVLVKIISYLPAKAFFKFLPVCKTIYHLSSDSQFLLSQSYNNKAISGFFIHSDNILRSFILIDSYAGVPRSNLEFLSDSGAKILGSAGGLVFVLLNKNGWFDASTSGICVYNPARGTRCWLPSPPDEESSISSHSKESSSFSLTSLYNGHSYSFKSLIAGMDGTLNNTHSINVGSSRRPLPDDLLAEILSYLPAKTFFRLLSVCKTFRQLSSDSHFLLSQSNHNNVISGFFPHRRNISGPFFLIDPYAGVPRSSLQFLCSSKAIILGSEGGLVFVLHRKGGALCVYNPARGTRCQLPSPPSEYCTWGGIAVRFMNDGDGVTKGYKLVYLSRTPAGSSLHRCQVYDSFARVWTMDKELDFGRKELHLEHPVVCDDVVFWASSHSESYERIDHYVVAFDVRKERTQIIPLPKEAAVACFDTIGIAKWEGKSLCLIHYDMYTWVFALWLLRKTNDGPPGWAKAHEVSLELMGFREPSYVSFIMLSEVATTTLLVFTIQSEAYSYDIKDGELKKLASSEIYFAKLIPYSNTLRPCGEQEELNVPGSFFLVDPYAGVPRSSLQFLSYRKVVILGSAGGLVFVLRYKDHALCVYNPARGTRCQLPSPPSKYWTWGGIGIAVRFMNDGDGVTKGYKLVYLLRTPAGSSFHRCQVYDSSARVWTMDKELDFGRMELHLEHPVVCDDVVFWASSHSESNERIDHYVVAFDVRKERTQIIPLPKEAAVACFDTIGIGKWEGKSLCLIHYKMCTRVFGLWLLRKTNDGPPGWVRVHEVSLGQIGFRELPIVSSVILSEVATTTLLVFTIQNEAYSYDIKDGKLKKMASLGCHYPPLIPYSNTLRPCGEEEELLETTR